MQLIKSIFRIIGKATFLLATAFVVVFCINNPQTVTISLSPIPFELETKLFLIILFCFFGGILIGFLSCSVSLTKEKFKNFVNGWKIKKLEKKVDAVEEKPNVLNNQ